MSVYLHDIPLNEARERFETALKEAGLGGILGRETIPLDENALGRVLAGAVVAKVCSPHYHSAAMDGFAVRADQTEGAQPASPILLHIGDRARYVDTGDPLPEGFDAVIPIENAESLDPAGKISRDIRTPENIRIRSGVAPWAHVRLMGEDIIATQLVLPAGQVLRAVDLGAIAAAGHKEIQVARSPRVGILPTGSELVPVGAELKPGDILEYNSLVLAAQVKAWGGAPTRYPIVRDEFEAICDCVREAARANDLVLIGAGSSAGAEDFSSKVVEKLGLLLVHGVAVRPGHPVILGILKVDRRTVPVIGVPGYPVSSAMTGRNLCRTVVGQVAWARAEATAVGRGQPDSQGHLSGGDDDYIRVAMGKVGEKMLAAPLARGAGIITSLVKADGLLVLPRGIQGAEAGETVSVHLYTEKSKLDQTIFCIGSHDLTLDLLAQFLAKVDRRLGLGQCGLARRFGGAAAG